MSQDSWYEVYVYTVYMNREYSQRVQIRIAYEEQTPVVFLELSFYFYHILSSLKINKKTVSKTYHDPL